jgi:hypothetical protein
VRLLRGAVAVVEQMVGKSPAPPPRGQQVKREADCICVEHKHTSCQVFVRTWLVHGWQEAMQVNVLLPQPVAQLKRLRQGQTHIKQSSILAVSAAAATGPAKSNDPQGSQMLKGTTMCVRQLTVT